jgi:hypothetical protein
MSAIQQVAHYCKIASPFLAAAFSVMVAYGDRHEGWKLARSILATVFFLTVGSLSVFVG